MTMKNKSEPKVLFYDVETAPIKAWLFRCGKQVVSPSQLVVGNDKPDIICICWSWEGEKKVHSLQWDKNNNSKAMIKAFTAVCQEADLIIGKNNKSFDDKYVNTMRMFHGLPGEPLLMQKVDDLQAQMKQNFFLPSHRLDYISKMLGLGGKEKMDLDDWIKIVEHKDKAAMDKMVFYCKKDVTDTKTIWKYCAAHFKRPVLNRSTWHKDIRCAVCGSLKIISAGYHTDTKGVKYRKLHCNEHHGYAGKIKWKT